MQSSRTKTTTKKFYLENAMLPEASQIGKEFWPLFVPKLKTTCYVKEIALPTVDNPTPKQIMKKADNAANYLSQTLHLNHIENVIVHYELANNRLFIYVESTDALKTFLTETRKISNFDPVSTSAQVQTSTTSTTANSNSELDEIEEQLFASINEPNFQTYPELDIEQFIRSNFEIVTEKKRRCAC